MPLDTLEQLTKSGTRPFLVFWGVETESGLRYWQTPCGSLKVPHGEVEIFARANLGRFVAWRRTEKPIRGLPSDVREAVPSVFRVMPPDGQRLSEYRIEIRTGAGQETRGRVFALDAFEALEVAHLAGFVFTSEGVSCIEIKPAFGGR